MLKFTVKKLEAADLEAAKSLFLFFQIDDGVENPTHASDAYLLELLARPDFHAIAAFEGETVIGGLAAYELTQYKLETRDMYLYEMAVDAAHRRRGVASELIERLKTLCAEKGIEQMFVGAQAANTPAVRLYQATGGVGAEVIEFDYEIGR